VLAIWFVIRFEAVRRRDEQIARHAAAALVLRATADERAARAAATRAAAYAAFDARDDEGEDRWAEGEDRWAEGEDRWAEALKLGEAADTAYHAAEVELEAARIANPSAVRAQMADLLFAHARLAEAVHDRAQVTQLLHRVDLFDPDRARDWNRAGRLVVELDRPATISVHPTTDRGPRIAGGFAATPLRTVRGTLLTEELAPGSYVTVIEAADGVVIRDPVLVGRGERLTRRIIVPLRRSIPEGFVYIPAGRFLYGTDRAEPTRQWLEAQPLHEVETGSYLIARTEVTLAQWMAYLRALPPDDRARRTPQPKGEAPLLTLVDDRFTVSISPTQEVYRAVEGQLLTYPGRKIRSAVRWERMPVAGISWNDFVAYTTWLHRELPGARPCTLHEWERAARGADGRTYPHGEILRPSDANFDATYDREETAFGPDEVGSFPASDSPFGLSDMSGNIFELTRGPGGRPEIKGGSWYQDRNTAFLANHGAAEPTERDLRIGLRVCAGMAR
jgi:formylglycine-generating enzyme required for sulfatase activity